MVQTLMENPNIYVNLRWQPSQSLFFVTLVYTLISNEYIKGTNGLEYIKI